MVKGNLLTSARDDILSKSVHELLYHLRTGTFKPLEVLEAFQAKTLHVDKEINAVCDYILTASDWARQLEKVPVLERGALYGLPVSVKVSGC